ncbi:MAG: RNA polymerase subunit sigma, partial [Pseudomonadota bacterium]
MSPVSQESSLSPSGRPPAGGETSDEALLLAVARNRDRNAFVQLFERYAARVKAYLMRGGAVANVAE